MKEQIRFGKTGDMSAAGIPQVKNMGTHNLPVEDVLFILKQMLRSDLPAKQFFFHLKTKT